ncbi:MAG: hypothetical protein HKN29_14375 [Rhodothermales bacterium]|nr:hypothetical protein [Rhodothermales bacterium]
MQLLSVDILPDGSASRPVRLQELPAGITSGGPALSAIPRFSSRLLGRVPVRRWEASVEADRSVSLIGAKDEADRFEESVDWTPDGRYKLSNRWPHIALSDTQTGTEIRHPIDRRFGGLRHVMNPVGLTPDGGQFIGSANWAYVPYERTWIRDSRTGIYVDSLNGVTALALTPERDAVVFRDDRDGACLSTITLRERAVEPLLCLDGARETEQADTTSGRAAWRPSVAFSRTGAYLAVAYPAAEGGRLVRVLATDGTLDEVIESLPGAPGFGVTPGGFELTPDEKGAYLIGEGQIAYYNFETRTMKPMEMSIPEGWRFRGGLQLHPDGKSADVRLEGEQLPRQLEFLVINRPEEATNSAGG